MKIKVRKLYAVDYDGGGRDFYSSKKELMAANIKMIHVEVIYRILVDDTFFSEFDYREEADMIATLLKTKGGQRQLELLAATRALTET